MTAGPFPFKQGPSSWEPVSPEETLSPAEAGQRAEALTPSPGRYYAKLKGFYATLGMGIFAVDHHCGSAILTSADETALAMDKLARENRNVAKIVDFMLRTGAFGEVLAAHMPILIAVLSHHAPGFKDLIASALRAPFVIEQEEEAVVTGYSDNGGHP
jgi:hypothetical protein